MNRLLPLLLLTGCIGDLTVHLPDGDGRIEVRVPEGTEIRLYLKGQFLSESRRATGTAVFDRLGPATYGVDVVRCPVGSYPDPASHVVALDPGASASVESAILDGAHVSVTSDAGVVLFVTEPVLDLPLTQLPQ